MQGRITRLLAIFAFATAALAGTSTRADAAFIAAICNSADCSGVQGDDWVVVSDNLVGDVMPIAGWITMTAVIDGVTVTQNTTQSKPLLTDGMDVNFAVTSTAGSTGTIWLWAFDTDFVGPETLHGHIGGTTGPGSTATALICNGINSGCLSWGPFGGGGGDVSFSADFGSFLALTNPYSLAIGVAVTVPDAGETTTGDLRVTPEPATMGLFGLALLGLGGALRRRSPA